MASVPTVELSVATSSVYPAPLRSHVADGLEPSIYLEYERHPVKFGLVLVLYKISLFGTTNAENNGNDIVLEFFTFLPTEPIINLGTVLLSTIFCCNSIALSNKNWYETSKTKATAIF